MDESLLPARISISAEQAAVTMTISGAPSNHLQSDKDLAFADAHGRAVLRCTTWHVTSEAV